VPHVRVGESVARILRERILRGEFEDSLLPKQEILVEEFGVSAPSIREAFRVLEAEGLITVRRGNMGGAVVHIPDVSDTAYSLGLALQSEGVTLLDVSEALWALEPMAAAYCASRPDRAKAVIPKLERLVDENEAGLDEEGFANGAQQFHDKMAELCGNTTIRVVINSVFALWNTQQQEWTESHDEDYPSLAKRRKTIASHRKIIRLIASGSAAAAERAERSHIRELHQVLLSKPDITVSVTSGPQDGRQRNN
jgi:GntR family transcriptional repressor for pyruvate dehydrogenase complex